MITAPKPLAAWTAESLMSREVKTIPQTMSLREAAGLLLREQISGAPVVDEQGRCIGMLSSSDFVRWAEQGSQKVHCHSHPCFCSDWQVVDLEFLPSDEVRWYMTADPVTVTPSVSITVLARQMLDAHIHRVVVVDWERRPIGIVSSTDILAAVASATAEPST